MSKKAILLVAALLSGCATTEWQFRDIEEARFSTLAVNSATKQDVLAALGPPAERSRVRMHNYEVWSYRYKQGGIWDALMHAHFDEAGTLRLMQSGPDERYDRSFFRN
jgi:hypothetical protein